MIDELTVLQFYSTSSTEDLTSTKAKQVNHDALCMMSDALCVCTITYRNGLTRLCGCSCGPWLLQGPRLAFQLIESCQPNVSLERSGLSRLQPVPNRGSEHSP